MLAILTAAAASLACLKHSARAAAADCFCAAASEIDNAKSAGTSRANANRAFGFCIIASFLRYRHNARSECTTISGDYLGEDEDSPSQGSDGCIGLDGLIRPNANEEAGRGFLRCGLDESFGAITYARFAFYTTMLDSTKELRILRLP